MRTRVIHVPCDCRCCELAVTKDVFEDGEAFYDVMVQDSRYDHKANGVLNRVRNALKVLFGKKICYNDVFIPDDEHFDAFLDQLITLRGWMPGPSDDNS